MRRLARTSRPMAVALTVAVGALSAGVIVRARQAPARAPVPMTASSLARTPDAYFGETVSLMAPVERVLSKTVFTVDQDKTKSTGRDILVVAPYLNAPVPANTYVTVVGVVVKFDPAEVARRVRDYTLDLTPDLVVAYQGRPAIVATSVITPGLVDIAKRVLPPPTPEENAFDNVMKEINPAFTALRAAIDQSSADAAKTNTAILKKGFIAAAAFFSGRKTADATGFAEEALKLSTSIEQAAAAGKWDDARTTSGTLQQLCQTCHAAHRDRADDGTYRVRGSSR